MSNNDNDHDLLIRNTTITEQTGRQLTEALQQLGRGNERFQRIDGDITSLKTRMEQMERQVPETVARLREDMLRAMGSVVAKTDENMASKLDPIQRELAPITDAIKRIHTLFKWTFATISGIIISIATAVLIAWLMHLISF